MTKAVSRTRTDWYCECGYPHSSEERANACGKCERCGNDVGSGYPGSHVYTACKPCRDVKEKVHDAEVMAKAEIVDYKSLGGSMIYTDSISGNQEGYFHDIEDVFEHIDEHNYDCEDEDRRTYPEFVYATKPIKFTIDAASLIQDGLTNHHEDAADGISDNAIEELQGFLDAWCKKQNIVSYYVDYKRKIDVRPYWPKVVQ